MRINYKFHYIELFSEIKHTIKKIMSQKYITMEFQGFLEKSSYKREKPY
jgi:hypothetical protein